jgi:TonB-dependent receptor
MAWAGRMISVTGGGDERWSPADLQLVTTLMEQEGDVPAVGLPIDPAAGGIPVLENVAGKCVITGEVSDAVSLDPLKGAIVDVIGTGRTVETDAAGRFRIEGIAEGTYTLEASMLGYFAETSVVTAIEAQAADTRFGLREKPSDDSSDEYTLEEETVVGEYQGDSGGDLFVDLEITSSVTSGLSKEEFTSSGVSDAAGAVGKISGANVVGGKYAVVRGLADRYSNTLVNDAVISSADPSKKAVQLDLFPSDLLESLRIQKTFTPDLPADFAGGTVLIDTLRIPAERIIEFSVGTKYRDSLDGDFYVIPGQRLDYWGDGTEGFADGVGQRGGTLAQNPGRFAPGVTTAVRPGQVPTAAQQEALDMWGLLHSTGPFVAEKANHQDLYDFSATYADSISFSEESKFGWVLALTREQGASAERDVEVQRLAALSGPLGVYRKQIENRFKESVEWGFLGSATMEFNENHSINFTYFKNRAAENEVNQIRRIQNRQTDGESIFDSSQYRFNYLGASGIAYRAADVTSYVDRTIEFNQWSGNHALQRADGRDWLKASWVLSDSNAEENRPDDRNLRFTTVDYADPRIPDIIATSPPSSTPPAPYRPELGEMETISNLLGGNPPSPYRQALSTVDEGTNRRMDFEIPIYFDDEDDSKRVLTFKAGVNESSRQRRSRGDAYAYRSGTNRPPSSVDLDQLFRDLYLDFDDSRWILGASRPATGEAPYTALAIQDITAAGTLILNSDSGIEVDAKYLMAALDWDEWNVYGGGRIEDSTRSYDVAIKNEYGVNLNNPTQANTIGTKEISESKLYPAFGISRKFGSENQFNFFYSWSKTVARPTFLEFAPVITEDQSTGEEIRGNPFLEDSEIDNFDLAVSWRLSPKTFLQASVFHKTLTNPITKVLGQRSSDGFFISYANAESGSIQGVEIEADHSFSDNWSIGGNVTYMTSELVPGISSIPAPILAESFEGQPQWILNANLGYRIPDHDFSMNLIYNFTGDYLSAVSGTQAVPSVIKDATHTLDFVLQKGFKGPWGDNKVTFRVLNLLDSPTSFSYESGEVFSSYSPGRVYSVSITSEF